VPVLGDILPSSSVAVAVFFLHTRRDPIATFPWFANSDFEAKIPPHEPFPEKTNQSTDAQNLDFDREDSDF